MRRKDKTSAASPAVTPPARGWPVGLARTGLIAGLLLILLLALGAAFTVPTYAAGTGGPALAPPNPAFLQFLADQALGVESASQIDRPLGHRPGPQNVSSTRGAQVPTTHALDVPPASYDLRSLGRVTSVKDQNPYGTCWAFGSYGSLESCLLPGETRDFSEDNLALNSGFYNGGDAYNSGGNLWMANAYLVRWGGPVDESEDVYGDGDTPAGLTPRKHVQEVNWIPPRGSALDNDNVKNAVMQFGGVDASISWQGSSAGSSYYNASTASYYYNGGAYSNHDVLIVGWDNSYSATNFATAPPGNGAFIVKNSWGTGWGSSGYFYVSYYDSVFGRDSYMAVFDNAESTTNYGGIYQYDPLGDCLDLGYGSSTGWLANVFTAQATASLGAVGFYTETPGTSYEVYTGTSFTGSTLTGKTLRTSGTLAYMGYHTVTLPTPVGVTSGQPFVVAVKVTSPGTTWPIAIEYPHTYYSPDASAAAGQSYLSPNGTNWTDLTTLTASDPLYADSNVCLKAYTLPAPAPTVSALGPTSGPSAGGTSVTITGANFTGVSAVTFGGTAATSYTVNSTTQIRATAPAHSAGTVQVQVTAEGGSSANTSTDDYAYVDAPTISGLNPTMGPSGGGATVVITGTNFVGVSGGSAVMFGDSNATSYTVDSPTQITARPKVHDAGVVDVVVRGTGGVTVNTPADDYTYVDRPTIAALNPSSGPAGGGTTVVITGTNFVGLSGASAVKFGSTGGGTHDATSYTVDSPTQITATSPAGTGTVDVMVTAAGGSSSNVIADDYTYATASTISHLYPGAGPLNGGNRVVIVGSGFAGVTEVRFGTTVVAPGSYTVDSPTRITVTSAPAHAAGTVRVQVTASGYPTGDTAADDYTYTASPTTVGLSTSVSGNGTVARTPDKATYYLGELVSLEAVPETSWLLVCWTGGLSGCGNPQEVVMDAAKSVGATFSRTAVQLQTGWNLVAGASGTAFGQVLFGWTGSGYESVTDPVAWRGYWVKASSPGVVYLVTAAGPETVALDSGWNLIGNPMDSAAALTLSAGRVAFVYDTGTRTYISTLTLEPGQSAWVRGAVGESVTLTAAP